MLYRCIVLSLSKLIFIIFRKVYPKFPLSISYFIYISNTDTSELFSHTRGIFSCPPYGNRVY